MYELALEPTETQVPPSSIRRYGQAPPDKVASTQFYTYPPVYPHLLQEKRRSKRNAIDFNKLSTPKRILSRGDVPWVYRYKVKKSLNELNKIMASKSQPINNEKTLYHSFSG